MADALSARFSVSCGQVTPIDPRQFEIEILSAADLVAWSGAGASYQYVRANPASPADRLRDEALLELLFEGALVSGSAYRATDGHISIPDTRPPNPSYGIDAAAVRALTQFLTENQQIVSLRITQRGRLRLFRLRDEILNRNRVMDEFNVLSAHRHWQQDLNVHLRSRVPGTPISLIVLDVDKLTVLNKELGHPGADRVLTGIFEELRDIVRPHQGYRIGGDEAGAILPGVPLDQATKRGEEVRSRVAARAWPGLEIQTHPTVSIGVGTLTDGDMDAAALYAAVDQLAIRAKSKRNTVVASPIPEPSTT
jgi:diguanylate cyclase (GGDEF)-like protein